MNKGYLVVKNTVTGFLVLCVLLASAYFMAPDFVYAEPDSDLADGQYQLFDYRTLKTHTDGKYICSDNPDYYFEVNNEFAALSDALYESQEISGGFREQWAMLQSFKRFTWLSFVTSYSNDGGGGFTDWKEFIIYTSDVGEFETFYVESKSGSLLPWETQVYKKASDSTPKTSLEERISFNAETLSTADESHMLPADHVFSKMGDRLYKLEIEKAIGGEVTGYRDNDGVPFAGFEYMGYRFEYKLSGDSYDILPNTILYIKAII